MTGLPVAITRALQDDDPLARALEMRGACPVFLPQLEIVLERGAEISADLAALWKQADWIVFTSRNAVRGAASLAPAAIEATRRQGADRRLIAVGDGTAAELARHGLDGARVPSRQDARGILELLAEGDLAGRVALLPVGDRARPELPDGLRDRGADVRAVVVYRTVGAGPDAAAALEHAILDQRVRVVTFTSGSAAQSFVEGVGVERAMAALRRVTTAVIGGTTAKDLARLGLPVSVVAERPSMDALAEAACKAGTIDPDGTRDGR